MLHFHDAELTSKLKHLQIHSCYLPYIGAKYDDASQKIFIVAESHYLHDKFNNRISSDQWYDEPDYVYALIKNHVSGITTRAVVNDYLTSPKLIKPYTIFHNLETAYKSSFKDVRLFEECVFINYFQRPAEENGNSIRLSHQDNTVALENLTVLNEILQPQKIIFVSSKAYNSFKSTVSKHQKENFCFVGSVPHPSSAWWNKSSEKFGKNANDMTATGKEKFERIIRPKQEIEL